MINFGGNMQMNDLDNLCEICDDCGDEIFIFMENIQKNKDINIKDFNSFLKDVEELSKEADIGLIGHKVLKLKRNWSLLVKYYADVELTTSKRAYLNSITECIDKIEIKDITAAYRVFSLSDDEIEDIFAFIDESIEDFYGTLDNMEELQKEEKTDSDDYKKLLENINDLSKFNELEKALENFEVCDITSIDNELTGRQKLWNVFEEEYQNLKFEKNNFVSEQILIIKEKFENVLKELPKDYLNVIDNDELLAIENEINEFTANACNTLRPIKEKMNDGVEAYKLEKDFSPNNYETIAYISTQNYYDLHKNLCYKELLIRNVRISQDTIFWEAKFNSNSDFIENKRKLQLENLSERIPELENQYNNLLNRINENLNKIKDFPDSEESIKLSSFMNEIKETRKKYL
ncbi:MAG: hypothetical protein UIB61_01190 [Treponema sp.]|nr:hypothetical protein [Treponema sp.]